MNLKSALPLYVRLASSVVNLLFWASAVMRLCSATGRNMYAAYSAVMSIRIVARVLAHLSCPPWTCGCPDGGAA